MLRQNILNIQLEENGQNRQNGQGTQKRDNTRPKCVETMSLTQTEQSVAVGTKFGPPGPSLALWGPQKGHFGPKLALSGPQGAQKRADIRPKCVANM